MSQVPTIDGTSYDVYYTVRRRLTVRMPSDASPEERRSIAVWHASWAAVDPVEVAAILPAGEPQTWLDGPTGIKPRDRVKPARA